MNPKEKLITRSIISKLDQGGKLCRQCFKVKSVSDFPYPNAPVCMRCKHGEGYGR